MQKVSSEKRANHLNYANSTSVARSGHKKEEKGNEKSFPMFVKVSSCKEIFLLLLFEDCLTFNQAELFT